VLDEFDKSLEIGFESEMKTILFNLPNLRKKVLTSATQGVQIPNFVQAEPLSRVNHLTQHAPKIKFYEVACEEKDKLPTLVPLLESLHSQRGIVFLNFKDAIERVSEALQENNINHVKFYGGTDQKDREQSLIQFRNNSAPILLATDLAARGIDVPALDYIVHYHLPLKKHEFTHRNGRTARMHAKGAAYVLKGNGEVLPDYLPEMQPFAIAASKTTAPQEEWVTLKISGGRKDKISKGDLVGFFIKQGGLVNDEIGHIELKQEVSFVAVPKTKAQSLIAQLNNLRVKKRKVRISKI
jgi:superfamily II DNA/RNA helicase